MKSFILAVCLLLVTSFCFAEISAKVLSYEKEVKGDSIGVKVLTEYTYPDGTKKIGTTRYNYSTFSKDAILADIKAHCETITKYYIEENIVAMKEKENEIIDIKITEQNNLPSKDRITALIYKTISIYDSSLDLTLNATGTIKDNYK